MFQLDFFPVVRQSSFDWKNPPRPELTFGDLRPGDLFQVITWVEDRWHVISRTFVKVEQLTILHPNSVAIKPEECYPYRIARTSFFNDVPVKRV